MPNGDGGGFDFGGLFDALLGELAAAIQAIIDFLVQLVGAIVDVVNFLFAGELSIFGFSFDGLGGIWKILKKVGSAIWHAVIEKALVHLLDLYQKIRTFVEKLKKWLDRFHALQKKYQVLAFRRVINLIQRARKILAVFRIFHFKFAAKLDHYLVHIETRLIQAQLTHARKTNEIIGYMNLILDPLVLFDGRLHLGSWARGLTAFGDLLSGLGLADLVPWLAPALGPGVPVRQWRDAYAQFRSESASNSGDTGAATRQFQMYAHLFAQDIGPGGTA